jgi:hypothetical protein
LVLQVFQDHRALRHVLEIILLVQRVPDHVHRDQIPDNVLMQVVDPEWLDQDRDQFVQVLQRVRNNDLMVHNVHKVVAKDLVAHHHLHLHIAPKVAAHHVPDKVAADLAHPVLVDQVKVVEDLEVLDQELVAHLVKVAERKKITRVRKLAAKRSTICKRQQLVVR